MEHLIFFIMAISSFKKAKSLGDILVVTLTADKFIKKGPGRPFYDQKLD